MKRNISVFSAIALAVVMSAFMPSSRNEAAKFANLYWYKVVGIAIDHTQPVNGGTPTSKSFLLAHPALVPCTIGAASDCIRGFTSPQVTDPSSGQTDAIQKQ